MISCGPTDCLFAISRHDYRYAIELLYSNIRIPVTGTYRFLVGRSQKYLAGPPFSFAKCASKCSDTINACRSTIANEYIPTQTRATRCCRDKPAPFAFTRRRVGYTQRVAAMKAHVSYHVGIATHTNNPIGFGKYTTGYGTAPVL